MLLGKLAEKQQIGTFLKAEVAVLGKSGNRHQCGAAVVGASVVADVLV